MALGGCGGGPTWPASVGAWSAPLAVAWRPRRLLVEAWIQGQGPYLVVVDPSAPRSLLTAPLARRLGVAVGARARARVGIRLGDLRLAAMPVEVVPAGRLGVAFERPVVALLGRELWPADGTLEVDRGAGLLRIYRGGAPPTPPSAEVVELDDAGRLGVEVEGRRLWLYPALGQRTSALTEAQAEGLEVRSKGPRGRTGWRPESWRGRLSVGGRTHPIRFWRAPVGAVGLWDLGPRSLRLDRAEGVASLWAPVGRGWLGRFGGSPPEPLRGWLSRKIPGRVWLRFERPSAPQPAGYWGRLDLGRPGTPYSILVRLRPTGARPLTATLSGADLVPERLLPVDAPLPLVDIVPVQRRCPGQVCVLRASTESWRLDGDQEGR